MENRSAIVIAVDGLRASALGTYGNTLFPTSHFDDLASRSLVVEWLLAHSPLLEEFNHAVWSRLLDDGIRKCLLTDDAEVAHSARGLFGQIIQFESGVAQSARNIEETHTARFFTQVVEYLFQWRKEVPDSVASLLWIHFSGLCGPWDAPLELREQLLDEEGLQVPVFVHSPSSIAVVDDPDELHRYRVAYAAQVSALDSCVGGLFGALETSSLARNWLAIIIGSRGFSLGEHGVVGHALQTLYSEQLHLPWLLLNSQSLQPIPRALGFAQPADIGITLRDWLTLKRDDQFSLVPALSGQPLRLRDCAISTNAGEQLIRTPAWMMKRGESTELYAKPDDRWETNNVASRCPDIVELLTQCLQAPDQSPHHLPNDVISVWR